MRESFELSSESRLIIPRCSETLPLQRSAKAMTAVFIFSSHTRPKKKKKKMEANKCISHVEAFPEEIISRGSCRG